MFKFMCVLGAFFFTLWSVGGVVWFVGVLVDGDRKEHTKWWHMFFGGPIVWVVHWLG